MKHRLLFFAIIMMIIAVTRNASAHDFWSVSSTGDTLYYTIWESSTWSGGGYAYLAVTCPGPLVYIDSLGYYDGWGSHLRPSGNVVIPNTVYYNGINCQVRYIDQNAFSGCRDITSITIPSNVREIWSNAFEECSSLLTLTVPSTVTTIYSQAFSGIPNVVYNGSATGTPWGAQIKNGYVSGDYVYTNSTRQILVGARRNITTAEIPNTVTTISKGAFKRCHNLTNVIFPSTVSSIGESAFEWCTSLQYIEIPSNITSIEGFAFLRCHNLNEVSFSTGLNSIGYGAFEECTSLSKIELPVGLHKVEYSAFWDCTNLSYISFPYTIDTLGTQILDGCGNLDTIAFDANIQDPSAQYAFDFLNLPDGVIPSITLILGEHITSIRTDQWTNQWLFHQLNNFISEVVMQCTTPPTCMNPCIGNNVLLKVPCMSLAAYQNSNWNCYNSIQNYQPYNAIVHETYIEGTVYYSMNCDTLSLEAVPIYGYDFSIWSDGDTNRIRTMLLSSDTVINALFVPHTFSVSVFSNNDILGNASLSGSSYYLDTVIVEAIASTHCHFLRWSDGSIENPHYVTVDRDTTLIAFFEPDTHIVTLTTINPVFGNVFGDGRFEYGSIDTLKAVANNGYVFTHWNDFSNENPRTITVFQDTQFVAFFTMVQIDTLIVRDTVYLEIHDTSYVDIPYLIHDTTIVNDTVTLMEYVPVHDTTYIDVPYLVHDTTTIDNWIYDTTYIDVPYAVHDTSYVYRFVHDTMLVYNYIHDTTFITQHFYDTVTVLRIDTVIDNNYIHDTSYVYRYLHDTTVVNNYIHDTTLVTNFVHDTVIVNRYIYDSTYIDRIVHDTVLLYRYLHDTTTLTLYDTLIFNHYIHDTTILNNYIHDTAFVDNWIFDTTYITLVDTLTLTVWDTITQDVFIHDTTILNNYIHDTTFVTLTDTLLVDVFIHDTTIVDNWIYDTTYLWQHDTTFVTLTDTLLVDVFIHDTTIVDNWIYDTTFLWQYDTTFVTLTDTLLVDVFIHDTTIVDNWIYDTTYLWQHDTTLMTITDTLTVTVTDTVIIDNFIFDTVTITDTLWLTMFDTIYLTDTIFIHDTIYVTEQGIDDASIPEAKIYASKGTIVVEGAAENQVRLYDITGRLLATRRDDNTLLRFDVPTTGTYFIKIGNLPVRKVVAIK